MLTGWSEKQLKLMQLTYNPQFTIPVSWWQGKKEIVTSACAAGHFSLGGFTDHQDIQFDKMRQTIDYRGMSRVKDVITQK